MTPFLAGFSGELQKLGASTKNPSAPVHTKMEKLLKGGLKKYVGTPDIRHPTFPSMREVANRPYLEKRRPLSFRPAG